MNLTKLLNKRGLSLPGSDSIEVGGISYDSRTVQKGDLFFAIEGEHVDGHAFIDQAAERGAVAAIVRKSVAAKIPTVLSSSLLPALSELSSHFYKNPSAKIPVIGVTGTNGKTTATYIIEDIFSSNGKSSGVMGTINYRWGGESHPAPNTTPMASDVQKFIAQSVDRKIDAVVMEVSSHALELHRVDDVRFDVGIFTNLTQDHLDFHRDMDSYFKAKEKLFESTDNIRSVINVDDPYGKKLAAGRKNLWTFGVGEKARVRASQASCHLDGLTFSITLPSGKTERITTNLLGRHNISNLLAAAGGCLAFGLDEVQVVQGLNQRHIVPGRLERVECGQDFVVVVDYAHTPDALLKVLGALKETHPRRLITVFGAGGDRDQGKRPLMGQVAVRYSDFTIITSDNPRTEDPHAIIGDIEEGIKLMGQSNYEVQENREKAIARAISVARGGDLVLIAGKGHETVQIYGTKRYHFSDIQVARRLLRQ